jgi:hypothetical protein
MMSLINGFLCAWAVTAVLVGVACARRPKPSDEAALEERLARREKERAL